MIGAGNVIIGLLLRIGVLGRNYSSWFRRYRNTELPFFFRNTPFGMVPLGVGLLAWVAAYYLFAADAPAAGSVLLFLGITGIVMGIAVMARPPVWLKPEWLRREEAK